MAKRRRDKRQKDKRATEKRGREWRDNIMREREKVRYGKTRERGNKIGRVYRGRDTQERDNREIKRDNQNEKTQQKRHLFHSPQ